MMYYLFIKPYSTVLEKWQYKEDNGEGYRGKLWQQCTRQITAELIGERHIKC